MKWYHVLLTLFIAPFLMVGMAFACTFLVIFVMACVQMVLIGP